MMPTSGLLPTEPGCVSGFSESRSMRRGVGECRAERALVCVRADVTHSALRISHDLSAGSDQAGVWQTAEYECIHWHQCTET